MKKIIVRKSQHGFLIIVPLILIVIIGFLGVMVAYIYSNTASSVANIVSSNQAFYIATSALETAKREIIVNNVNCSAFNASNPSYTNVPLFTGYYSVNGTIKNSTGTLNSSISNTTAIVPLTSSTNFLSAGAIRIDDEVMSYFGKSGNNLINVIRGIAGTNQAPHNVMAGGVTQNVCVLSATAGVPNLVTSTGRRTLQQVVMLGYAKGVGVPGNPLPGSMQPVIISGSGNGCGGSKFNPPAITIASSITVSNNFSSSLGCDLASAGCVEQQGGAANLICQGSQPSTAVWSSNYNAPAPAINTGSAFFDYFFTDSLSNMMASAQAQGAVVNNPSALVNPPQQWNIIQINPPSGQDTVTLSGNLLQNQIAPTTLIINGNLDISNLNLGSSASPIRIIVTGNLQNQSGNGNIYGFLYVQGGSSLYNCSGQSYANLCLQSSSFTLYGAVATQGTAFIKNVNTIVFDSNSLRYLGLLAGSPPIISVPEVFQ